MKKTKILLVLAIAMLAMFAMSACTLIASGIEKVEFEVMPKNYFSTTEIAEGFDVSFTATIAGKEYPVKVEIEAGKTKYDLTVGGFPVTVNTNKALETTMGEHEIVVTAEGVMATYAYRVCTPIATAKDMYNYLEKNTDTDKMGYYIMTDDVTLTKGDVINVAKDFVLYGDNHTVYCTTQGKGDGSVKQGIFEVVGKDNGFYEFNNVRIIETGYKFENGKRSNVVTWYSSCIRFADVAGATLNLNACYLNTHYYAIHMDGSKTTGAPVDNVTINVSNGSTAEAWAFLYTYATNSVYNIDGSFLYGRNIWDSHESNTFGTVIVAGSDNVVNINDSVLMADTYAGASQYFLGIQQASSNSVINLTNCKDKNGVIIDGLRDNMYYINSDCLNNRIYLNGNLFE
jgi:hypothetical protein